VGNSPRKRGKNKSLVRLRENCENLHVKKMKCVRSGKKIVLQIENAGGVGLQGGQKWGCRGIWGVEKKKRGKDWCQKRGDGLRGGKKKEKR